MDASTLRWTIVVIGVVILAAIFLFGSPEKKRKPRASRRKIEAAAQRQEPTLESAEVTAQLDDPDQSPIDSEGQGELLIEGVPSAEKPEKKKSPRKPAGPPPDKIITLFLMARDNHILGGVEILEAGLKTGMEFGEMNIFHRLLEGTDKSIFSMANATKPGVFNKDEWNTFETNGLALFMTLPGPTLALDAWDVMLATARRMAEILNSEIHDDQREVFTRQNEAMVREAMREYDRGQARQSLS
jgi:cell division protein ZipA